jgi:aryl-alcohol dehydrogenase
MEGPCDDEVLVRLVASGICHTDIDFCESGGSGPVVLGHEGSGVVERTGKAVKGIKPVLLISQVATAPRSVPLSLRGSPQ